MIELHNINKTYSLGKSSIQALNNVSLKISEGEFVAIMGPSGSGKSTLLHILGLLDRPDSGQYILKNKNVTLLTDDELAYIRNKFIGFVFQQFYLLPKLTALENVKLPLIYSGDNKDLSKEAESKIAQVGLLNRIKHRSNELSGGEQQRVAIARALVNEPFLILADEPTGNLDTKTEKEIIKILKDLNRNGKTVVLITHELEVGEVAKRIIFMRDGRIIDERIKVKTFVKLSNRKDDDILNKINLKEKGVKFIEHIKQSIRAIFSHKLRSALSILGILIGIVSVITMLALGEGAKEAISKQFAHLGSNLLSVRKGFMYRMGVASEAGIILKFDSKDVEEISALPEVKYVSPNVMGNGRVVYGNKNWNTRIQGVGVNYENIRAAKPVVGRFFTEEEFKSRQKVCLIGNTVYKNLFGNVNPVGATVKINRINFKVIGLLPVRGASGWHDEDDIIIMPATTAMFRVLGKDSFDSIDVEIKDASLIEQARKKISSIIIKKHKIPEEKEEIFEVRNLAEIQEAMTSTITTISTLLGIIAAISLIVGGIGIMNIMLVSVTERTKEIGLRKAIGARNRDILNQFLIESTTLTLSGGILGILTGVLISKILASITNWNMRITFMSIMISTFFSFVIGLCFGIYPAIKASKLNPVEALRYE